MITLPPFMGIQKPAQAATFNPADYGSSYSWYAARLETGFSNGQSVSSLTDRGTVGMLMTDEGFPTRQPRWMDGSDPAAANGQPLFRYDLDALVPNHGLITTPMVAAIVYRSTQSGYIFGGISFGNITQGLRATSTTAMTAYRGITISIANTGGYNATGWQVCMFGLSPANANILFFKSGMTQGSSPNNYYNAGASSGAIGVSANSMRMGVQNWRGDIAELVIWRSEIDFTQRVAAGKKLADIYGITY